MTKRTRIATLIATMVVAAIGTGSASAGKAIGTASGSAEEFVPGHSDFPNVLRIQDENGGFIAGHTDFPSRLGTGARQPSVAPVVADARTGFDWAAAGVGAMGAFALVLMIGGTAIVLRSRTSARLS